MYFYYANGTKWPTKLQVCGFDITASTLVCTRVHPLNPGASFVPCSASLTFWMLSMFRVLGFWDFQYFPSMTAFIALGFFPVKINYNAYYLYVCRVLGHLSQGQLQIAVLVSVNRPLGKLD